MWKASLFGWLLALVPALPAEAVDCGKAHSGDHTFTVCKVDAGQEEIRFFLNTPGSDEVLGSFRNVDRLLNKSGQRLILAMNGGMYHPDRKPVGHYIEDGSEYAPVISSDGPGNFGLLPNGIFCVLQGRAQVIETKRYLKDRPRCRHASQSGPMLVIDGRLHPRFLPDSDSRYIRNGVGTSADGASVWFAISDAPVTFHEFGTLFRDVLKTPQALYFDGNISRLYAPGIGRHDGGFPMGPIVGVVNYGLGD